MKRFIIILMLINTTLVLSKTTSISKLSKQCINDFMQEMTHTEENTRITVIHEADELTKTINNFVSDPAKRHAIALLEYTIENDPKLTEAIAPELCYRYIFKQNAAHFFTDLNRNYMPLLKESFIKEAEEYLRKHPYANFLTKEDILITIYNEGPWAFKKTYSLFKEYDQMILDRESALIKLISDKSPEVFIATCKNCSRELYTFNKNLPKQKKVAFATSLYWH